MIIVFFSQTVPMIVSFMSYRVQTIIFKYGRNYDFGLQHIRSVLLDVIHCLKINIQNMKEYKCRE